MYARVLIGVCHVYSTQSAESLFGHQQNELIFDIYLDAGELRQCQQQQYKDHNNNLLSAPNEVDELTGKKRELLYL